MTHSMVTGDTEQTNINTLIVNLYLEN